MRLPRNFDGLSVYHNISHPNCHFGGDNIPPCLDPHCQDPTICRYSHYSSKNWPFTGVQPGIKPPLLLLPCVAGRLIPRAAGATAIAINPGAGWNCDTFQAWAQHGKLEYTNGEMNQQKERTKNGDGIDGTCQSFRLEPAAITGSLRVGDGNFKKPQLISTNYHWFQLWFPGWARTCWWQSRIVSPKET